MYYQMGIDETTSKHLLYLTMGWLSWFNESVYAVYKITNSYKRLLLLSNNNYMCQLKLTVINVPTNNCNNYN